MLFQTTFFVVAITCLARSYGQESCGDVKKRGFKVNCTAWDDPNCGENCEWAVMVECKGPCGGGIQTKNRIRTCVYLNEDKSRVICEDSQDRREKCKPNCGPHGKYNEALDFCHCNENYQGECCDKKLEACTNPIVKKGETDRSIAHVGRGNRCDNRLRPGWYRFDSPAGGTMPTACVPYGSCNTVVPFWMNGTHPKPEDGVVDRQACGTHGDDCCRHKLTIKVKNCDTFMAYYLKPTGECVKAYCVGAHEKCPPGQSSSTGFQPNCTSNFPKITVTPTVGYHIDESHKNNTVSLTCSARHADATKYMWKVQWYFDGQPGPSEEQKRPNNSPQPTFYLPSTAWASKMGTEAQCSMQAKLASGLGTWSLGDQKSQKYYLGIVIPKRTVTVAEGDLAYVTLHPNLPVRCSDSQESQTDCHLMMAITMDPTARGTRCPGKAAEISEVIFQGENDLKCAYKNITHTNWRSPNQLRIKPKLDLLLDGDQTRTLRMTVHEKGTSIPDFWRGYILPSVQITIKDADNRGTCKIISDPHIHTFDNRHYDFHDRADRRGDRQIYVLYKNTRESEEIQARFYLCLTRNNVYCACGVAIRAESSIVVFDRCKTGNSLHPEFKKTGNDFHPSLRVFQHNNGANYHVFLPTGTQVKIAKYVWSNIQIDIKASVDGQGKTMGLCGNYNGNPRDDIQDSLGRNRCENINGWTACNDEQFRKSWLVPENDSIFAGKVPPHDPNEHMKELYCDCVSEPGHHGYEDCDYHKRFEPCDDGYEIVKNGNSHMYAQQTFPWLDTYRTPEHQNPSYVSQTASQHAHYYSNNDITEFTVETARAFCISALYSSPAVTTCLNEVPNQNYNSSIEACALDLVFSGSTELAADHLEGIKSGCSQELKMNMDLWEPREEEDKEGDNEEKPDKPVVVAGPPLRLMENLCPNECSGNGACFDGKCICKKGFTSYDCSLKVDDIPVLKGVSSSSLPCDKSHQDCSVIALEGDKYLNGPNLTCHYYKDDDLDNKYFYSGPASNAAVTTSKGIFFSLWIVQCGVPQQLSAPVSPTTTFYKLQVSISNDGLKESDRALYSSFDATCETCIDKNCIKKAQTCIISSQCYVHGDVNPMNTDEVCNPSISEFAWAPAWSLTTTTARLETTTVLETTTPPETTTVFEPTTIPVTTTERKTTTSPPTTTTTTESTDDGEIVCNAGPQGISFHRDPKNCSKYYVCEDTNKHHMSCPEGLAFSNAVKVCVPAKEVPGCG